MHEEAQKLRAGKPLALRDPPIRTRNGELKDIFCQVDTNDRSIHIGLLLVRAFAETLNMLSLAHRCRTAIQEESISTVGAIAAVGENQERVSMTETDQLRLTAPRSRIAQFHR
jgi:hypothetical protein